METKCTFECESARDDDRLTTRTLAVVNQPSLLYGPGYLQKTKVIQIDHTFIDKEEKDDEDELATDDTVEDVEERGIDETSIDGTLLVEYHIVYSTVYKVPIMFFKVEILSKAREMTVEEVKLFVPQAFERTSRRRAFVTQMGHPILCRPYFCVHPCHTMDCMNTMLRTRNSCRDKDDDVTTLAVQHECSPVYMLLWYNLIAPLVHLDQATRSFSSLSQQLADTE